MDVVALYPNVPWEEGLVALQAAGERRSDKSLMTDFLTRLMTVVLDSNIFEFRDKLYRGREQLLGPGQLPHLQTYLWGGGRKRCSKNGLALH